MNRSSSLIKNTMILGIGTMFTKMFAFIMLPFFSRWLSAEDYGTFELFCTYITLMFPVLTFSCGEAVFRFLLEKETIDERKPIVTGGYFVLISGLAMAVMLSIVLYVLNHSTLVLPFMVMLIAESLYNFNSFISRGLKKISNYTFANILFSISMSVSVVIFVYVFDFKLYGIMYGYAIGYATSAAYMMLRGRIISYINPNSIMKQNIKEMLKYSIPLIPNSISWWIANVSDRTIIRIFLGATFNGVYAIANKIPALCTSLFTVFHLSWQQNASETINDSNRDIYYSTVYNKMIQVFISICICVLSLNFVFFEYILDFKYLTAYNHVAILLLAVAFSFIAQFFGGIFIGLKMSKVNGSTTVIAALTNLVVHYALIKFIGLYAASVSTLVSCVVLFVIRFVKIKKQVAFNTEKKSLLFITIFAYFIGMQYVKLPLVDYLNVLLAVAIFLYTNKNFIRAFVSKALKR